MVEKPLPPLIWLAEQRRPEHTANFALTLEFEKEI